jgi:tripartite-type tricarboxylate transporter receptor subunit TctC
MGFSVTGFGITPIIRLFVLLAALATCGIATESHAQGGTYPSKPIRVLIPFGPGSATDIIARLVTDEMRQAMGQTFLIENRAGANGFIAAEAAAKAPADGYTLFVTASTTHSTNPSLFKKLPYDPVKDFAPVGGLMQAYYTVTVNNDLPVKTLGELIAYLKANEGKTSFGWGATVSQLSGVSLLKRIGATATGVPYKSSPQAVVDLIGGQLTFVVQDITTALAHVKGNRVRALAVTSPQRIPDMPNVPTMEEAGLPGFTAETWIGMYAPAATPGPIIARLSSALQAAVKSDVVKQKMTSCCSSTPFPSTPAQFSEYVAKDRAYWAERIKEAGIQPE